MSKKVFALFHLQYKFFATNRIYVSAIPFCRTYTQSTTEFGDTLNKLPHPKRICCSHLKHKTVRTPTFDTTFYSHALHILLFEFCFSLLLYICVQVNTVYICSPKNYAMMPWCAAFIISTIDKYFFWDMHQLKIMRNYLGQFMLLRFPYP